MIHELRIYHCLPGRLPNLHKRFETVTLKLWEKHGIRQAGFWTVQVGESNNDLYYLLEWESMAECERKWSAFASDPEWLAAKAASEADGPIVGHITNMFLKPTPYSSVR
ncbi:NIPSNAP family protein [Burkholderiaceae bacterium FT117]|uniref:NIPSNAP family protein n=1 Tax=Zeimonas sediminis TaxID=2944268 RepID=UPI002342C423|nr:NIPSNAP family protein [Zeimonas sediminis]MCM5569101.1 NIPSNAP family protein [Zeimonas sediminis]